MQIEGGKESSISAYAFIFFIDTTTARKISVSIMNIVNIYKYCARVGL